MFVYGQDLVGIRKRSGAHRLRGARARTIDVQRIRGPRCRPTEVPVDEQQRRTVRDLGETGDIEGDIEKGYEVLVRRHGHREVEVLAEL